MIIRIKTIKKKKEGRGGEGGIKNATRSNDRTRISNVRIN